MSHLMVLILVPPSVEDKQGYVSAILAPYNSDTPNAIQADEQDVFARPGTNMQGKWDYWVFGGRFDGVLIDPEHFAWRLDDLPYDHQSRLLRNSRTVKDLPLMQRWSDEAVPGAIVTPDGVWHDRLTAKLALANDTPWRTYAQRQLSERVNCDAVCVDCHT